MYLTVHPSVLQDIGPLGPLPKKEREKGSGEERKEGRKPESKEARKKAREEGNK